MFYKMYSNDSFFFNLLFLYLTLDTLGLRTWQPVWRVNQ